MPEDFGARLRAQRERRQMSLAAIADQTKISAALLEALERDDLSRWPSGLFRRAFVRAYASVVGLDPEATVREFLVAHPEPVETVAVPVEGVAVPIPDEPNGPPPTRLRGLVGSAVVSLGRLAPRRRPTEASDAASAAQAPTSASAPEPALAAPSAPAPAPALAPVPASAAWNPDVTAAAQLSTELGRVADVDALVALLARMAELLHASGVIVWIWDLQSERLWPALAYGYSDTVLAHVPPLQRDDPNATAAVFRSGELAIVEGGDAATGAVVAPLVGRGGCAGVLAMEVRDGAERHELVRALVTIFAAQIAPLVAGAQPGAAMPHRATG